MDNNSLGNDGSRKKKVEKRITIGIIQTVLKPPSSKALTPSMGSLIKPRVIAAPTMHIVSPGLRLSSVPVTMASPVTVTVGFAAPCSTLVVIYHTTDFALSNIAVKTARRIRPKRCGV